MKQLVQQNFEVETWYDDMTKVSVSKMPGKLDLYSCGFPCQPYSAAGKGLGLGDARATPLHVLLQYVARHRPNMVLLENVEAFSRGKHKEAFELVLKRLRDFGVYEVNHNIVNTLDHWGSTTSPQVVHRLHQVANDAEAFLLAADFISTSITVGLL